MIRKTVFIIGASGGIGSAIAKEFARDGYNLILSSNNTSLKDIEKICEGYGTKITKLKIDVTKISEIEKGFEKAFETAKYLESVIICPGISLEEKLLCDESVQNIQKLIDVNLLGVVYCNREAQKHFLKVKHGSIINISSIYGIYGGSCESVYSATKGGIIALTKALSDECASFGVRVNCVAPGWIQTNMTKHFNENEVKEIIEETPLKRLGIGEDVAKAVRFLSGDESSFITGEIITVSGGVLKFK